MGSAIGADEEQLKSLHCKLLLLHTKKIINQLLYSISLTFYLFYLVNETELRNLYKKFNQLDTDKSGKLEPQEFLDIPCKKE